MQWVDAAEEGARVSLGLNPSYEGVMRGGAVVLHVPLHVLVVDVVAGVEGADGDLEGLGVEGGGAVAEDVPPALGQVLLEPRARQELVGGDVGALKSGLALAGIHDAVSSEDVQGSVIKSQSFNITQWYDWYHCVHWTFS